MKKIIVNKNEKTKRNFVKKNYKNYDNRHCNNCGKRGHYTTRCKDPITSCGIIPTYIDVNDDQKKIIMNKFSNKEELKEYGIPEKDTYKFMKYKDKIKFLMVRRKNSIGYLEFIRGRYEVNDIDKISSLFSAMAPFEIEMLVTEEFSKLWNSLWLMPKNNNQYYKKEFNNSKNKFYKLKNGETDENLDLEFYAKNVKPMWKEPEWGFPKGRREKNESDLNCAKREFYEETDIKDDSYEILSITPYDENIIGTNGKHYRRLYYPALMNNDNTPTIDPENIGQVCEIGDIRWVTYVEMMELIRNVRKDRMHIMANYYITLLNLLD